MTLNLNQNGLKHLYVAPPMPAGNHVSCFFKINFVIGIIWNAKSNINHDSEWYCSFLSDSLSLSLTLHLIGTAL